MSDQLVTYLLVFRSAGSVCEEPECTGVSGPAGGAVLQIWAEERASCSLPAAHRKDEGSGLRHAARWEEAPRPSGLWRSSHRQLALILCVFVFLLADAETAQNALRLLHGYRLLGKPLVVEFGRERQEEEKQKERAGQEEKKWIRRNHLWRDRILHNWLFILFCI